MRREVARVVSCHAVSDLAEGASSRGGSRVKKGDKITVVVSVLDIELDEPANLPTSKTKSEFRRGTVRSIAGGRITYYYSMAWSRRDKNGSVRASIVGIDTVAYSARGISWARGWEGAEVAALEVAVAVA